MSDRIEKFQYVGEKASRLDKFLVTCLPEFSRARLQGLIDNGFVSINGVPAKKTGQSIDSGAEIEVRVPPPVPSGLVKSKCVSRRLCQAVWWARIFRSILFLKMMT